MIQRMDVIRNALIVVVLLGKIHAQNTGECKSKPILPNSIKRGTSNFSKPGQEFVSDDIIVDGWYSLVPGSRLASNASGLKIGSCGTLFPIWLNGTHPSLTGETLTVTACMKTYFDVCDSPFPVQIINCGTHYNYYLKNTTVNSAFCIGDYNFYFVYTLYLSLYLEDFDPIFANKIRDGNVMFPLKLIAKKICIIGATSEEATDISTSPALYYTPTSMTIITTDFRGDSWSRPGNDTYFGDDSSRKLGFIIKTTTIVFSAVILCPMTVLLVAFLFKLKKRKMREMKVRDQKHGMPVFFIPTSNGWMKADKIKIKSFSEPLVVTDFDMLHFSTKNKEMI